jgi:polyisoprenoid-binding protein YceI
MKLLHALRSTAFLVAASLVAAVGSAQTSTWKIDPVHSGIEFRVLHLGVSHVSGSFSKVTGVVQLDDKEISHSKVDASVDVSTLNTQEPKRDDHLKSPEFFNLAQFPAITFKSTSLSKVGDKLQLTGDLTLAGVTKSVTLTVDGPAAPQKGMGGAIVSGFSATGTLSRKDFNFGQKYVAPMLGDDVTFTIDIEMDKQP